MKRAFSLILYYGISSKLPSQWWPGGKFFNGFRVLNLRGIIALGIGNRIQSGVYVGTGKNIRIGSNCQINENVRLDNVTIGNNVMIARESVILGKMHETSNASVPMTQQGNKKVDQTVIEDDVWLGLRSVVMPGLRVAKGTVLGAGAILTKDTEPFGIYVGIPAKLIRKRH